MSVEEVSSPDTQAAVNGWSWMGDTFDQIGARPLRNIAMPGAHDAGMSVLTASSLGSDARNTQTQVMSIGQQLQAGVRYFDFRPVTWDGAPDFYHGHFSAFDGKYFGSTGQSLSSTLYQLVRFVEHAASSKEVVILKLSHYMVLEKSLDTFEMVDGQPFDYGNFHDLADAVLKIEQHLFTRKTSTSLNDVTLADATSPASGRVIVVFDLAGGAGYPASLVVPDEGCFSYSNTGCDANLVVYDEYSGTDNLTGMARDQEGKFRAYRPASGLSFLLSWTLTQTDPLTEPSILQLAQTANGALISEMEAWATNEIATAAKIPSIIAMDNVTSPCVALQACLSLNRL